MGRIVGLTLVALGLWVMYSIYRYARAGEAFRLRSRWMLVFDTIRYGSRRFGARLHGHEHVEPLEMSSYGAKTSFGVGMIHGIGAETGTQVLLIAAVGGAASAGLGIPMLFAFVIGLLMSNLGDRAAELGQLRVEPDARAALRRYRRRRRAVQPVVGSIFLFGLDGTLPDLGVDPAVLARRSAIRLGRAGRPRRAVRASGLGDGRRCRGRDRSTLDRPAGRGSGRPPRRSARRRTWRPRASRCSRTARARNWPRMLPPAASCGKTRRDVEERLRPDVDDADLDQLMDGPAEEPAAMKTRATPVQRKKVARFTRRDPW